MSADELSDTDLARLKFELAEAITPVAIKGPIVKRLVARLARVEAELANPAQHLLRLSKERDVAVRHEGENRWRAEAAEAQLSKAENELKDRQEELRRIPHLVADSNNLAAERDDARHKAARLRDAFEAAHKRIEFVFGATQNVSWERFLFELREGIKGVLKETEGVLVLKSPLDP